MKRSLRLACLVAACLLVGVAGATMGLLSPAGQGLVADLAGRSPQALVRHLQQRLQGHDQLERLLLPALHSVQRRLERPPPATTLPTLGKGQQALSMATPVPPTGTVIRVGSSEAIAQALQDARPGTHIVIEPGRYAFMRTLRLGADGEARAPIVLTAIRPGTVQLAFSQVSGIQVDRPHWTFENLDIRGTCATHHECEHAFHVVGRGAFTVLRNNHLQDFNAPIKVNGLAGDWPDHGLLAFNTITNTATRRTDRPVVMLDLVGASHWKVQDNLVTHFAKGLGNQVSYGLFMKGAGEGGRIERNLVICTPGDISRPGVRVGISFGGGGTDAAVCRTDACRQYEHRDGLGANNIVAHCNDAGMDVNRSQDIALVHNTLINTAGFSTRRASERVRLMANLYEGNNSVRESAAQHAELNHRAPLAAIFVNPDALLLQWLEPPESIPSSSFVTTDFFGSTRPPFTAPGAVDGMPRATR